MTTFVIVKSSNKENNDGIFFQISRIVDVRADGKNVIDTFYFQVNIARTIDFFSR